MADLYTNYAELAANEQIGVEYDIRPVWTPGTSWASIAIHGGGIEPGTSEIAEAVAGSTMRFYEFDSHVTSGSNTDLHITSANFDEPQALAMVTNADRCLSFHGYTGTTGVSETLIGGNDNALQGRVMRALQAAGFTVTVASSEYPGTDPLNICNRTRLSGGVQLEMSRALRESFFTDFTRAGRKNPANRTAAFNAYVAAIQSASATRGGLVSMGSVNVSRWTLLPGSADVDLVATFATDRLAAGGPQYIALVGRWVDASNCYLARVELTETQQVLLTLRRRQAGTDTVLGTYTAPLTHIPAGYVSARLQIAKTILRASVWGAEEDPPAGWHLSATDTTFGAAGQMGMRFILSSAYTGALPVTAMVRDFSATALPSIQLASTAENGPWTEDPADLPLDLRVGGERVTASAIGPALADTFTRTVAAGGWGGAWSVVLGAASAFSADGVRGVIGLTGTGRFGAVVDTGSPDQDVILSIRSPVTATGGSIIHGWMGRYVDNDNHYYVEAQFQADGQLALSLAVRSGAVNTVYVAPTPVMAYTAGTTYRLGVQLIGQTYRARAWPGGTPPDWQVSRPATATPAGTRAGVRALLAAGNTNAPPVSVTVDNFEVQIPQLVTLSARGVNGVARAWPSGTEVDVWTPAVVAL